MDRNSNYRRVSIPSIKQKEASIEKKNIDIYENMKPMDPKYQPENVQKSSIDKPSSLTSSFKQKADNIDLYNSNQFEKQKSQKHPKQIILKVN